jgi:hypothetical protein
MVAVGVPTVAAGALVVANGASATVSGYGTFIHAMSMAETPPPGAGQSGSSGGSGSGSGPPAKPPSPAVGQNASSTSPMAGRRLGHTFTKHGAENTSALLKEAAGSGRPVGQWLDNAAAERFIAEHLGELKNGARTFDLPAGMGRVVNPDGTFSVATKARLVPSGSGVKTAFPLIE